MKNKHAKIMYGFAALAVMIIAACSNPFAPPDKPANNTEGNGLVHIYIGEDSLSSRTVQPAHNAIAGYQLTFSSSGNNVTAPDPVDITEGNSAEVALADGEWTITAKAYKSGGTIGENNDAVASGSITITLSNGVVSGTMPNIILRPMTGTGDGTLSYDITLGSAVSGYMKLFEINGSTPVNTFGQNGELDLSDSVANDYTLAAGRYIAEVKLTNDEGNIAFRRDVVEIWAGATTDFVFAPNGNAFVDPNAALVNTGARLSEADTKINNVAITGAWTGNGNSEQNARTYTYNTPNAGSVSIELIFELNSQYSTISWAATTGAAPGAYSTAAFPSSFDFSTNNTLWIKVVSEDGSTTRYYKFVVSPPLPPSNGIFTDTDYNTGRIGGTIIWSMPDELDGISGYRIYYGSNEITKLYSTPIYPMSSVFTTSQDVAANTQLPASAKYFLIYSCSETGDYPDCLAIPIVDLAMPPTNMGAFTVTGTNPAGIAYTAPNLTITQSGTYYITGTNTETTDRIRVLGDNISADIVINNVNINVSGTNDAVAFDANVNNDQGVTVNLTIEGTNTLRSGANKAGLQVPSNTTLAIDGTGSLNATGGNGGAGIGGGSSGAGGTISITGGMVTATGGDSGAGIGGTITAITGNAVVFASSIQPELPTGENLGPAVIFNGDYGDTYGDVSLKRNVTIPAGKSLFVRDGDSLTIQSGYTLTNNGVIVYEYGANIAGTIAVNQPILASFTISGGAAYTYRGEILTITGNGTYTIGMRSGVTSTTVHRIAVASGVNADITLSDVNIDMSSRNDTCAFDITGATVNLTLVGENILKSGSGKAGLQAPDGATLVITEESTGSLNATGGSYGAGIGGGSTGGTISIAGGTVIATGGDHGAGIGGGGDGAAGGTITISGGTVTATCESSQYGAGIGGSYGGAGGTITITGGSVTAGASYGAGIGGGGHYFANSGGAGGTITITGGMVTATGRQGIGGGNPNSAAGTITAITGNAIVFANSMPALPTGENLGPAIVFNGNGGNLYGNFTLWCDLTIDGGKTLAINDGLTIQSGYTLTNNGTIYVAYGITITGVVSGNPPVLPAFAISGGTEFTYTIGLLTITGNGTYTIGMRDGITSTTVDRIVVASGVNANITLSGVNIDTGGTAFDMTGATVYLTLVGENVLKSGSNSAGLQAPSGATLVITEESTGSLAATGGDNGAGIGGGNGAGGTITISGGTVTATGGFYQCAGIGGGRNGAGGTISITGGTVTANGGYGDGAGIGGGLYGAAGTITAITGNAIIFASSIQPELPTGNDLGPAIVFNGNDGNLYGNFTLWRNLTIDEGKTLAIPSDGRLTIGSYTLQNNGTINVESGGTVSGTVSGNQPNMQ